jgi:hypothetical protein
MRVKCNALTITPIPLLPELHVRTPQLWAPTLTARTQPARRPSSFGSNSTPAQPLSGVVTKRARTTERRPFLVTLPRIDPLHVAEFNPALDELEDSTSTGKS